MNFAANFKKSPNQLTRIATLCAAAILLTGCGGGGSEPQAQNDQPNPAANAALTFDSAIVNSGTNATTTYDAITKKVEYGAKAHLSDVGVIADATGQGVSILVIDDFKAPHTSTAVFSDIQRKLKYREGINSYAAIYNMSYELPITFTHGQLVSDIAGGAGAEKTLSTTLKNVTSPSAGYISCTLASETIKLACPSTFPSTASSYATLVINAIPGVASAATIQQRHADLSASQDLAGTVADIHGHLLNSMNPFVNVINLSLGSDIPTSGKTKAQVVAMIPQYPLPTADVVITVAAGNSGKPCNVTDLNGCNAMAVALLEQAATKDSTIVVGALTGPATAQKMALYSTSAGFLANRYILASGDTGWASDIQGTSFAAPRVAGVAAILKQKFPKLTSAEIANVILDSADKDVNNDGKPFTGVHPTFGQGKLSLENALKLAATR